MKKHALIMVAILSAASPGHAQIVVHDTSVTVRNAVTATLWEYLLETQVAQHGQLRRWAQRLSMFTDWQGRRPGRSSLAHPSWLRW